MEYSDQIEKLINVVVFLVRKLSIDSVQQSEIEQSFEKVLQLMKESSSSLRESVEESEEDTLKDDPEIGIDIQKEEYIEREETRGEKFHVCPLPECQQSFHSFQVLLDHSQSEHQSRLKREPSVIPIISQKSLNPSPRKYQANFEECPLCHGDFPLSKLYSHVFVDHVNEKDNPIYQEFMLKRRPDDLVCSECGETFTTPTLLGIHMREKHKETVKDLYKHKCGECGKAFMRKGTMDEHFNTVHCIDISICPQCGESYQNPIKLKRHIKQHHNRDYARDCGECGKKFNNLRRLKAHVDQEHLGIFRHRCEICGKTFQLISGLKKHLKEVHTDDKPFICEVCDFKTARLSNLNLHRFKSHQKPALTIDEVHSIEGESFVSI